jgi:hypothetical protein
MTEFEFDLRIHLTYLHMHYQPNTYLPIYLSGNLTFLAFSTCKFKRDNCHKLSNNDKMQTWPAFSGKTPAYAISTLYIPTKVRDGKLNGNWLFFSRVITLSKIIWPWQNSVLTSCNKFQLNMCNCCRDNERKVNDDRMTKQSKLYASGHFKAGAKGYDQDKSYSTLIHPIKSRLTLDRK